VWRNGGTGLPLTQANLQRALAQIPAGSTVQPTHFTSVGDPSLLPGSAPGDIDMPGPATPCTLTTLVPPRKARRKTTCVLLPTGRAPLDVVLEVLTMSGIVGAHLAAELNVPPVALSRLRHDCIGDDGFVFLADGDQQATQSALLWGLCDIAAKAPPVRDVPLPGWLSWATWCYLTGSKPPAHWPFTVEQVQGLARACASYLTTYKSPLVLVRFLSGLSSGGTSDCGAGRGQQIPLGKVQHPIGADFFGDTHQIIRHQIAGDKTAIDGAIRTGANCPGVTEFSPRLRRRRHHADQIIETVGAGEPQESFRVGQNLTDSFGW
jgi:hypothetical protein